MDSSDAIAELVFDYAARVDAGDFEAVGELFAHGAFRGVVDADTTSNFRGADEVRSCFEGMVIRYDDGTPRTKHVTTNLVVDVDEAANTATARSYFTVLQAVAGSPLQIVVAGRYFDTFERVDGQWRFADRLVYSDLVGDLSRHLRGNPLG